MSFFLPTRDRSVWWAQRDTTQPRKTQSRFTLSPRFFGFSQFFATDPEPPTNQIPLRKMVMEGKRGKNALYIRHDTAHISRKSPTGHGCFCRSLFFSLSLSLASHSSTWITIARSNDQRATKPFNHHYRYREDMHSLNHSLSSFYYSYPHLNIFSILPCTHIIQYIIQYIYTCLLYTQYSIPYTTVRSKCDKCLCCVAGPV